jgi:hypothetical protein
MYAFGDSRGAAARAAGALAVLILIGACSGPQVPGIVMELNTAARDGAGQAHLAGGGEAPLYLSWQEPVADGVTALRVAQFDGAGWSDPRTVAEGSNWFINWADFPSVVPIGSATMIAHWLTLKPDERYAYDITYALSRDGGRSWTQPRVLNADTAIAEHGFVSFFEWGDGAGAVWLDGRAIAALTIDELFELEEPVGMTLRFARLNRDGDVLERGEIDDLVCDCCQTDAATTSSGAPLIVYRDRTTQEVRDIVVRRAQLHEGADGQPASARWDAPRVPGPDGWVIDGCPVNGPALAARGEHIAVAWFTAANNQPRLRFARSRNAGADFDPALTLASQGVLGQADVVVVDDGTAWVSSWHQADAGMELRVHRVDAVTAAIDSRVVAKTAASLPTDVPQMGVAGDLLVFAWSELGDRDGNPGRLLSAALPVW